MGTFYFSIPFSEMRWQLIIMQPGLWPLLLRGLACSWAHFPCVVVPIGHTSEAPCLHPHN